MTRRLDVLIPHFNDPLGLRTSVRSIAQQTWPGQVRMVVVDDASDLSQFAASERSLGEGGVPYRLLRNDRNRGRPYSRNRLLDSIEGTHVAWLDAGDRWYAEKIDSQFSCLDALGCAERERHTWVTCDYDWNWDDGRSHVVQQECDGDQLRALMQGRSLRAYLWTLLASAESMAAVGAFDAQLPRMQDLDFFLRFVASGGRLIKPVAEKAYPLCAYEKSDVGRDAQQIRSCARTILEKHRPHYEHYGDDFVRAREAQIELLAMRFAKNNGQYLAALSYLGRAVVANPRAAMTRLKEKVLKGT